MACRFSWHTIRSMNQILQQPQEFQEPGLGGKASIAGAGDAKGCACAGTGVAVGA